MPLVLRIDVDKPYGRATFKEKVYSKIREELCFPAYHAMGYLDHLGAFLTYLSEENIRAYIYFRKCTIPLRTWKYWPLVEGHELGFHAENTRSYDTLKLELEEARQYFHPRQLNSFTKHGSGQWKSGRNHYPAYEPEKYIKWASMLNIYFKFGNEEAHDSNGFREVNNFYSGMFWIERCLGEEASQKLQSIINIAKDINVIVIIHPSNFVADKRVDANMRELVSLSRKYNVPWITL